VNPSLLTVIPRDTVDDDVLAHIDLASRQAQVRCTLFRGVVTGKLWVVFHPDEQPSEQYLETVEAEEIKALPTAGAMQ
jgi:hypothetical protein